MATTKKIETVDKLSQKVTKAKSIIFTDYVGLKHKQLEDLRKQLKKADSEIVVTKNKLLLRALGDKADSTKEMLREATASLFSYADEVAPLKIMLKFFKVTTIGKVKGGLLGQNILSDKDVTKLASLPTREVLLGKLVCQLNAPIQGFHYALSWNLNKLVWALDAVKSKKVN
jgi:large subunit ribosomal protein L10